MVLDSSFCLMGDWIGNSSPFPIQEHSARMTRSLLSRRQEKRGFQEGPSFSSIKKKAGECFRSSESMCMRGSMQSMPPGIERESIVPESLQERKAERQLIPRTICKIMPTEGKLYSWFTTIRALHRPVVPFQGIHRHRNRVESHLRQSGNSLSHHEGERLRQGARPNTTPMATVTRPYSNQLRASILILILLMRDPSSGLR